jgi:hypothetical protein
VCSTGGGSTKTWQIGLILLAGSLAVSLLFWSFGLPFFFLFLCIPIIPFLMKEKTVRRCPLCRWETTDARVGFCPYDASPLMTPEKNQEE